MNNEEWHRRLDDAVRRAERVRLDDRLPIYVHSLAEDVIWLAEYYGDHPTTREA